MIFDEIGNGEEVKEPRMAASVVLWYGSRDWVNTFIGDIIRFETPDEAQSTGDTLIRFLQDNPEAYTAYRGFALPDGAKDKIAFVKGVLKKAKEPVERGPRGPKPKKSSSE